MAWSMSSSKRSEGSGAAEPGTQGAAKCQKCWDQTELLLLGEKHGLCAEMRVKDDLCFPWKRTDVQHPRFVGSLPWDVFCQRRYQVRVTPVPPHGCMAPVKLVTVLAECVLAPGEAALTQEENLCSKGELASFRWCSTKAPQQPWWSRGKWRSVGLWDEKMCRAGVPRFGRQRWRCPGSWSHHQEENGQRHPSWHS